MTAEPGAKLPAVPTRFQSLGFWLLVPLWIGFSGCWPSVASGDVVGGAPESPDPPVPPEPPLDDSIGVTDEDAVLEGPGPAEFVAVTENV